MFTLLATVSEWDRKMFLIQGLQQKLSDGFCFVLIKPDDSVP